MELFISEGLRECRGAKGNTQEELATHLGISVQAVSKWERGEGYPDITHLPAIALYYDVSVDTLLGVDEARRREKAEEYVKAISAIQFSNTRDDMYDLARKAHSEFPNNLMLCYYLMNAIDSKLDSSGEPRTAENTAELVALGERIISESNELNDTGIRSGAIQTLCFNANTIGDYEGAKRYACMTPMLSVSREILLSRIGESSERLRVNQILLRNLVHFANAAISDMLRLGEYTIAEKIKSKLYALELINGAFDSGDKGDFFVFAGMNHVELAELYLSKGDFDAAVDHIERSSDDILSYYTQEDGTHTSPLFNTLEHEAPRPGAYSQTTWLLRRLEASCYDTIREDARFVAVTQRLKQFKHK